MINFLILLLAFIVAISVLVAVHEFGHYWVARRLGIKVLRFSIGFGKPLWKRVAGRDQTEYVISSLPLGGYVKMLDEREGPVAPEDRGRAFNHAPVWARLAVLFAGPAFNFLFAVVVYWAMFMYGVTELRPVIGEVEADSYAGRAGLEAGQEILAVSGQPVRNWQQATLAIIDDLVDDGRIAVAVRDSGGAERDLRIDVGEDKRRLTEPGELLDGLGLFVFPRNVPAVIGEVHAGAARETGLLSGDRVLAFDQTVVQNWNDLRNFVEAHPGESVEVAVERGGVVEKFVMVIGETSRDGRRIGLMGVSAASGPDERRVELSYGPLAAAGKAVAYTGEMTAFTVRMLWRMLTGDFSAKNLSGPITIAEYAGETAKMGPSAFLSFLAVVSISLGILNLLPVPILDGGQIVFQLAEAVKGSPLSAQTELRGQQIGILLLLMLMSLAFYNDILRLIG